MSQIIGNEKIKNNDITLEESIVLIEHVIVTRSLDNKPNNCKIEDEKLKIDKKVKNKG